MDREHIKVERREHSAVVIIDDWELFDYVDDFLNERGLEYDYLTEGEAGGHSVFTMHFPSNVPAERLSTALAELPSEEVERIWHINNR